MGHYYAEMNPEPEKKMVTEKKIKVIGNLSDPHCQNCAMALVCKFSEKALECKNKVSELIPEELKGFLSFQFQCRHYLDPTKPGIR